MSFLSVQELTSYVIPSCQEVKNPYAGNINGTLYAIMQLYAGAVKLYALIFMIVNWIILVALVYLKTKLL